MMEEEEVTRHLSFAKIRFSRINGHSGYLFGSEIQHIIVQSGIKALSGYQKPIIREIE